MNRNKILKKLHTIEKIPTMFNIALKLEKIVNKEDTTIEMVTDLIKFDPALTSKIMKIANSATYASTRRIINLNEIVSRLGFSEIRKIALSVSVMNIFQNNYVNYSRFWTHSITTAYIAEELLSYSNVSKKKGNIFACGMLHDIGVMILDQYFSKIYKKVFELTKKKKVDLHFIEKKALGIDHAEVGGILLKKWNVPTILHETVRYHHEPWEKEGIDYKDVLYLANFICNNQGYDNGTGIFPDHFYDDIWINLGLEMDCVPKILEDVEKEVKTAKQLIKLGSF